MPSISANKLSCSDLALNKRSASAFSLVNLSDSALAIASGIFFGQSFFFNNFVLNDLYHKKSAAVPMTC